MRVGGVDAQVLVRRERHGATVAPGAVALPGFADHEQTYAVRPRGGRTAYVVGMVRVTAQPTRSVTVDETDG